MNYNNILAMGAAIVITAWTYAMTASAALAQEPPPVVLTAPEELVIRHITYEDLNLASAAGERTLNHRVETGVTSLCTEITGGYAVSPTFEMIACRRTAWNQARPQISQAVQRANGIASTQAPLTAAIAIRMPAGD